MSEHLPSAKSLNVLMIALGDEVITGWGDTRERHIEYAERVGHLHMVAYSPRRRALPEMALSDHLTVYPTRSATRPSFICDTYHIGARICHQERIDVITTQDPFATGMPGVLLKWRFGIPLDVQNHSDFFDNREWITERPLRYGFFNWLGKRIIRHADTHRVLNEVEKAKYVAMGIDPAHVAVLSTPVRLERFQPETSPGEEAALRTQLGIPPRSPVLLWVGNPVFFKRVPSLIEAFARVYNSHPDAHLVLIGDFSVCPAALDKVAQLGLGSAVHFVGMVAHDALPPYYRLCSVYVHSSMYEGLGKVMIEAASCGKPIVSTRTAGAQAIVLDGKTGLLCEVEDPADMADKVVTLLNNPNRAAEMGVAGRAYVTEKFDRERNMRAIIQTWQRAAAMR